MFWLLKKDSAAWSELELVTTALYAELVYYNLHLKTVFLHAMMISIILCILFGFPHHYFVCITYLSSSIVWYVTQRKLVDFTDVSGQSIGPFFKSQSVQEQLHAFS
jgi:membrane-associated HD superfamily phosphohydrolase